MDLREIGWGVGWKRVSWLRIGIDCGLFEHGDERSGSGPTDLVPKLKHGDRRDQPLYTLFSPVPCKESHSNDVRTAAGDNELTLSLLTQYSPD
jgi:hypothetical protein